MKFVSKLGKRFFIHFGRFNITLMNHHANYEMKAINNYYHLSLPFNPLNKKLYGFYKSPDGTPSGATYYRPKRDWGIIEPQDPSYKKLVDDTSRS